MHRVFIVFVLSFVIACAPRGQLTLDPQASLVGSIQPVFIGTTRDIDEDGSFGTHRSEKTYFGRYDISIPPKRKAGEIKYPPRRAAPDPQVDFLTTSEIRYPNDSTFRQDLRKNLIANGGEAVIFVHGFNNNFAEGLYRVAQFSHDLRLPGTIIHYSWPSAANPLGYVYDRDSALFARDGLENLIQEVSDAGANRILLVAHSMGAALTMEALRQTAIRGNRKALNRIAGVILISPDIDVDVFREQAHAMGKLPQPFIIFGSDRDKVLRISAGLTGQSARLGSIKNIDRLADLDVTFLDVSNFSEGAGHFVMGDSAALLSLMSRIIDIDSAFERDRRDRIGLLPGAILTVQNATEIVLAPVGDVAAELTK